MITRAGISDLADLLALETSCFPEAWSQNSLAELLQNPAYLALLERDEAANPLAYLIGWEIEGEAELARIGVAPRARGQGRASRILEAALAIWRTARAQNVWLEVRESNLAALELYRSRGFQGVGKRANYYADGEHALVFRLKIAS